MNWSVFEALIFWRCHPLFLREQFRWIQEHLDRWFHIMADLYEPARNMMMTHNLWVINYESKDIRYPKVGKWFTKIRDSDNFYRLFGSRNRFWTYSYLKVFCLRDICQWSLSWAVIYCTDLLFQIIDESQRKWKKFIVKKRHWKNLASILTSTKRPVSHLILLPV